MNCNMGIADRIVRIAIAVLFAVLYFANIVSGTWGIVLLILGGIFLITSFIGFCPLYSPFGIRTTCKAKEDKE